VQPGGLGALAPPGQIPASREKVPEAFGCRQGDDLGVCRSLRAKKEPSRLLVPIPGSG